MDMDSTAHLTQNIEALVTEMSGLKALRDNVAKRGDPRMDDWLQSVKDQEGEIDEIETDFKRIGRIFNPITKIEAKNKLNKRVFNSLVAVKVIIQSKDEISKAMEKFISEVATGKPVQFSEGQLKIFTSNFKEKLGFGESGTVYKGKFPNCVEIAVKVMKDIGMNNMEREFRAEVTTMSKTSHRNLAKLYGFCFEAKMKALVYEYVENGSLDKILYREKDSSIQWEDLYNIAIKTAKVLSYLHEDCDERIIHRDIKAGNVLLGPKFSPKVTDFGLATLYNIDNSHVTLTSGFRGARNYDAPELRMGATKKINFRADIFSFGMMLFEFISRTKNSEGKNSFRAQVWEKFKEGVLDEILTGCGIEKKDNETARRLCIVALLCIEVKPRDRRSMSDVVNILVGVTPPPTPRKPFFCHDFSSESNTRNGSTSTGFRPQTVPPALL